MSTPPKKIPLLPERKATIEILAKKIPLLPERKATIEILVACFLVCGVVGYVNYINGIKFLETPQPATYIRLSIQSLYEHGTVQAPYFLEIAEQARTMSLETSSLVWQDVFCLTTSNVMLPKQAPIMVLLGFPFYSLMGAFGLWLLNVSGISLCLILIYRNIEKYNRISPILFTCIMATMTEIVWHSYFLSYDIFGALFILLGVVITEESKFAGGFVATLSIFFRPSNIIFSPILSFLARSRRELYSVFLGVSAVIVLFMTSNFLLFGSIFSNSYFRAPFYDAGNISFRGHSVGFSIDVLRESFPSLLISMKSGWLIYNPILVLVPLIAFNFRSLKRSHVVGLLIALVNLIYILTYHHWNCTIHGNRFLLPGLFALSSIAFEALLGCVALSRSRRFRE